MSVKNWLRKKAAMAAISLSNVEKNATSQMGEPLGSNVTQVRRHTEGQLADSLLNGKITKEVENLRWRTYKILAQTDGYKTEITGYDEHGLPITKTIKKDKKKGLDRVKLDPSDSYQLEMVINNSPVTIGVNDAIDTSLSSDSHQLLSQERPIHIKRPTVPKFKIENYTQKLNIRTIDDTKKLLEFYVSSYPDEYNRTTRLFLSDVKKAISNPMSSSMIEITEVSFITNNTMGADDFLQYSYKILSFDKIVEYDGHFIIKFIGEVDIDGKYIAENYRISNLDEKYNNKDAKK